MVPNLFGRYCICKLVDGWYAVSIFSIGVKLEGKNQSLTPTEKIETINDGCFSTKYDANNITYSATILPRRVSAPLYKLLSVYIVCIISRWPITIKKNWQITHQSISYSVPLFRLNFRRRWFQTSLRSSCKSWKSCPWRTWRCPPQTRVYLHVCQWEVKEYRVHDRIFQNFFNGMN